MIEWAIGFSIPVESAAAAFDEVRAAKEIPFAVGVRLEDLFFSILNCAPSYRSKVGDEPAGSLGTAGASDGG